MKLLFVKKKKQLMDLEKSIIKKGCFHFMLPRIKIREMKINICDFFYF